jgi:two-component SAPR family response regulator
MLSEIVTNLPYETFQKVMTDKNLVLIYPTVSYRNVFLSYFLQAFSGELLYYRLPYDGVSLKDWLVEICEIFPQSNDEFRAGSITTYYGDDMGNYWGNAFAKYLQTLPKHITIIYLDEIDRTTPDRQFRDFIGAVIDHLPSHLRLVINSRMLIYQPWIHYATRASCVILGTNLRKDNLMFTPTNSDRPQLEVYSFGQGSAFVNGQEIRTWDGALPRQMFYYFIDSNLVTRDQIFQTFWPSLPVKEATNVFHVTKRKISEQITRIVNDGGDHELTSYGAGFYTPNINIDRHYDVVEFEQAVGTAVMSDDENQQRKLYERAVHLYKGDFLLTMEMRWVKARREKLRLLYVDSLIGLARITKRQNDHEISLGYYVRALREVPLREDVHRDIITLYMKLGRKSDAVEQYRTLERLLNETLQVTPSKESRKLYEKVLADD